jgi:putative DNA-invertase from lambdoid prophage Rac
MTLVDKVGVMVTILYARVSTIEQTIEHQAAQVKAAGFDRLGRNYDDVCDTIRQFMGRGVIIRTVINGMTFDGATKDPIQKAVRDALIGFMAGRSHEGVSAGRNRARQGEGRRQVSRPQAGIQRAQFAAVREMLGKGTTSIAQIARRPG